MILSFCSFKNGNPPGNQERPRFGGHESYQKEVLHWALGGKPIVTPPGGQPFSMSSEIRCFPTGKFSLSLNPILGVLKSQI